MGKTFGQIQENFVLEQIRSSEVYQLNEEASNIVQYLLAFDVKYALLDDKKGEKKLLIITNKKQVLLYDPSYKGGHIEMAPQDLTEKVIAREISFSTSNSKENDVIYMDTERQLFQEFSRANIDERSFNLPKLKSLFKKMKVPKVPHTNWLKSIMGLFGNKREDELPVLS